MTLHLLLVSFLIKLEFKDDVLFIANVRLMSISPFVNQKLLVSDLIDVVVHKDMLETVRKVTC